MVNHKKTVCWCGNLDLEPFSDEYLLCSRCNTIVLKSLVDKDIFTVKKNEDGLYGKSYWFEHQEKDLGYNNIITRARTDIPERVLYWLEVFLKYKIPPANTLELGCSHGGFVAILQLAGFQASGLELSPWVVDFARKVFHVPMLLGPIEKQDIPAASLDAILLMDVLEHIPGPSAVMSNCLKLLKPDGILLIQTPRYQEGKAYQKMLNEADPFLKLLKAPEHIYLFSQSSITKLFQEIGARYSTFEPAFFNEYDMFLVVSRSPLKSNTQEQINQALMNTPGGRIALALLDKNSECRSLSLRLKESEIDRANRLTSIKQYEVWLKESQAELKKIKSNREAL